MELKIRYTVLLELLLLAACQDELPTPSYEQAEDDWSSVVQLEGSDGYVDIAGTGRSVKSVDVLKGDFIMDAGDGRLYYEENDDPAVRTAQVHVTYTDGTDSLFLFAQPVASRAAQSGLTQFYRHYGIGYSYEAVEGNYCDLRSFRSQVLNRAVLEKVEKERYVTLLRVNPLQQISTKASSYSSVVEYVQNSNFTASGKADLIVYAGEVTGTCSVFEDGSTDTYILHDELSKDIAEYSLSYSDLNALAQDYPSLLTSSFRSALSKITDTNKSIDDFINQFGTHVVVYSKLGARMSVDIQAETKRFNTVYNKELLSKQVLATLFHEVYSKTEEERYKQILKECTCRFSVTGGDVSAFDKLVGMNKFDSSSYTTEMKTNWLNSIKYDDSDIANSNIELIDMKVIPIWNLIPDEALADRVEARVTGNMGLIIETLGNKNFINTAFPAHPTSVTCRIGTKKNQTFTNPSTVDVIVSNRHVATICKEYVPEISATEQVFVAYPIYEGRIKMTSGLCIYDGKVYHVDWSLNRFTVSEEEVDGVVPDSIYMNWGALSVNRYSASAYQTGHLIVGSERPGGIGIDGSLSGELRLVQKHFGHFYLDNTKKYDNLPEWTYTTTEPSEANEADYSSYFTEGEFKNRMVRNDDYIYIWNQTEIGYE
jgi:hypothetical protein